jgi:hypothetical protein
MQKTILDAALQLRANTRDFIDGCANFLASPWTTAQKTEDQGKQVLQETSKSDVALKALAIKIYALNALTAYLILKVALIALGLASLSVGAIITILGCLAIRHVIDYSNSELLGDGSTTGRKAYGFFRSPPEKYSVSEVYRMVREFFVAQPAPSNTAGSN